MNWNYVKHYWLVISIALEALMDSNWMNVQDRDNDFSRLWL